MRIDVLGCPVDALTLDGAVARVADLVVGGGPSIGVAINPSKIVAAADDPDLRDFLSAADLAIADGVGVVLAARLAGHRLPGRVTGIDLLDALFDACPARGWRPFLLGARADVVAEAAERVALSGVDLAGFHHGYAPDADLVAAVRAAAPDLLFVALGSPKQEQFLARYADDLAVPFAMGVGGSFDVLAGRAHRAPAPIRDLGLEWAWRWGLEPRRLARRNARTLRFLAKVARARMR